MSFGWLGTFRQGSWQAFRRFVLEERRDFVERMITIQAELTRIGNVRVYYAEETDADGRTTTTEERRGFSVTPGSSLGKLIQVYVAMGGNPFDISLFLTPDAVVTLDQGAEDQAAAGVPTQPYEGVIYPLSATYTTGDEYKGGYTNVKKYVPARVGGQKVLEDYSVAGQVRQARGWANQSIRYRLNDIEARIIKLCDLKDQLKQELQDMAWAAAGVDAADPYLDEDKFDKNLTVAGIVALIDAIFYERDEDGTANFDVENTEALGYHPYLLSDQSPDEDNTAL